MTKIGFVAAMAFAAWTGAAEMPRPLWHGFNLEGKAIKGKFSGEWREQDLAWMHELGFNFARVMLDHRYCCMDGDWTQPDPAKFGPIDEVIAWGRKHQVHIQICFSFPPGIDVNTKSKWALYTDDVARRAMVAHWGYFARRYRDVSPDELSFNLFNEPDRMGTPEVAAGYERLVKAVLPVVHRENPDRIFVIDGYDYGRYPVKFAQDLPVWQSHHAYQPMGITHYKATWTGGAYGRLVPMWPPAVTKSPIFGDRKVPTNVPIVIRRTPAATLVVQPGVVNRLAELTVKADGRETFRKVFRPSPAEPGWTNLVKRPVLGSGPVEYGGELLEPIRIKVPAADKLEIGLDRGDWMELDLLTFETDGKGVSVPFMTDYTGDPKRRELSFVSWTEGVRPSDGKVLTGDDYLDEKTADWKPLLESGRPVMVGEFGVFNETPHDVALGWMETQLKRWKAKGIGWALWNFRGAFGILDSDRKDVKYEDFHGHKLDRKMLELLQKYR